MPKAAINREHIKYGLIVILGGVFLKVLAGTGLFGGGATTADSAPLVVASQSPTPRVVAPARPRTEATKRSTAVWPNCQLSTVVAHNPFQSATAQKPKEQTEVAEDASVAGIELKPESWPVDAFLEGDQGAVAVARGHTLKLGQIIEEKWRVTAVNAEFVNLDPL